MEERHRFDYEAAFERATDRASRQLCDLLGEAETSPALLAELLDLPPATRVERARNDSRFQNLKLCELLQAQARRVWTDDPVAAVQLAHLAVEIAGRFDSARFGCSLTEDSKAVAWAYLGNAYRVASDLRRAEEALRIAQEHHHLAGEDAFTEAEILGFTASLRKAQGRFEEAAQLLDRTIRLYRAGKDRHLEGRALIKKGTVLGDAGRFRDAILCLRRGLSLIDGESSPRLVLAAWHNLTWCLNDCGGHTEAQEALEVSRRLYHDLGDRMYLARLSWLEGRIAWAFGRLDEAEATLREARSNFIERGIGFDAAQVSLDLAILYAQRGDHERVKRLAAEMVPIFESRDVHHNALAALLMFQEAAEAERITLGFLDRIASFLKRTRRDPEMRFEAES
jgi:tetratricopeptide (TPR) repeat protein